MLSFEFDNKQTCVVIHLDVNGVDFLIERLARLKKSNVNEHEHLMSKEWGGSELDTIDASISEHDEPINHVKIFYWEELPFEIK